MTEWLVQNDLFRITYCFLADGSERCEALGHQGGLLEPSQHWLAFLIAAIVVGLVVANGVLVGSLGLIWGFRRLLARFQSRTGPNRWGPFGLLTPLADALKFIFKEDIMPAEASRLAFNLAPVMAMLGVLLVVAFIPFGEGLFVADVNVALVFILGLTSLSALSILIAGWASGNRVAIISSMRAVAVLISYEIPAALSLVGVVLIAGSLSLGDIIAAQTVPFILVQPLAFLVFVITTLAETGRTPFDVAEAESELGAGHLNDYSGMKFGLMYAAEFVAEIVSAAIITARASWPRLRVDQILQLAWKGIFELTLVNIVATAILVAIFPSPSTGELWIMVVVNWIVFFAAIFVMDRIFKRGAKRREQARVRQQPYPVAEEGG